MFKIDQKDLGKQFSNVNNRLFKEQRNAMGRTIRKIMDVIYNEEKNVVPVVTGATKRSLRKYSNILKGGLTAYGRIYVDPELKYNVTETRNKRIRISRYRGKPVKNLIRVKQPYKYALKVEIQRRWLSKFYYKNKSKYQEMFAEEFSKQLNKK